MNDFIFTFKSTHDAIMAEQILLDIGLNIKVMPMPGGIKAGCGICLRINHKDVSLANDTLNNAKIFLSGIYRSDKDKYIKITV